MDPHSGSCPVCKQKFADGDDVVICPSCGAPYHRACYREAGHCLFEDQHGAGFEYKDPDAPAAPPPPPTGGAYGQNGAPPTGGAAPRNSGGVLCPNCRTVNDAGNIFCENCGHPLSDTAAAPPPYGGQQAPPPFGGFGQQAAPPPGADLAGTIDGLPKQDWAEYVGQSAPVYLMRLSAMEQQKRKISFMLSAFFVSPCYFAYRKMWGWAALALVTTLINYSTQLLVAGANAGINFIPALSSETILQVFSYLRFALVGINMLYGLFALQLYRKQAVKNMMSLRGQHQNDFEYRAALGRSGGVSVVGVLVIVTLIIAYFFVAISFMGEDTLMSIYSALYNI